MYLQLDQVTLSHSLVMLAYAQGVVHGVTSQDALSHSFPLLMHLHVATGCQIFPTVCILSLYSFIHSLSLSFPFPHTSTDCSRSLPLPDLGYSGSFSWLKGSSSFSLSPSAMNSPIVGFFLPYSWVFTLAI